VLDVNVFGVKMNGKWGVVNKLGNTLAPTRYDKVETTEGGLVRLGQY
jgi:hypothetical protein